MEGKKILLVEDDPNFGAVLKDYLMKKIKLTVSWLPMKLV